MFFTRFLHLITAEYDKSKHLSSTRDLVFLEKLQMVLGANSCDSDWSWCRYFDFQHIVRSFVLQKLYFLTIFPFHLSRRHHKNHIKCDILVLQLVLSRFYLLYLSFLPTTPTTNVLVLFTGLK